MKALQLLFVASLATSAIAGSPLRVSQVVQSKATTPARNQNKQAISSTQNVAVDDPLLDIRGGACSDSSPALFFKIGTSAALETATMVGLLVASKHIASKFQFLPDFFGLPLSQWVAVFLIIYGSSFFGSLADGSLSAATQQALDPNTTPGDPEWYAKLQKPSWNPPGWVFPIMWLLIAKPTQVLAVTRLLKVSAQRAPQSTDGRLPLELLTVYCAHLSLGDAWNKVFFGLQCPGRGVAVITVFYGLLLASAYLFGTADPLAGKWLLPTCGWVLVASALNWNIYLNNKTTK
jgi:benzodiazapine receptor